jgi:predicted AlkP superfamily pyrophosphatase or phosphodiesterase
MRADYLERFFPQLSGGLGRLMRGGAWFTNAYQDHAMSETAPGHATTLSGRNPNSTGIYRNDEGVGDNTLRGSLLEQLVPGASPWRFRGTTLFDWMHARWPRSRALSVSRKDRGAILPVGRSKQQVYWYQGGQFTTSRYYADTLPGWVRAFNAAAVAARAPGRRWDLLLDTLRDPSAYPEPDSMDFERQSRDFVFPHVLPADTLDAATAFIATPWMDSLTLALALEGVQRLGLGRGPQPDLLAISLSATDYIGHAYGPDSREQHDQILRLDRWLGAFLDSLARLRDTTRIVISLTADHGVTSFPEWWNRHGDFHAQWVSLAGMVRADSIALAARAGPGRWIRYFETGLLVMDRAGLRAHGVDVDSVVNAIATEVRALPPVLRVDTRRSLAARDTASDWIARRWLNLAPPDLPAELFVTLKPHMSWAAGAYAQHGQPTDDDTHVPIILYGPPYRPGTFAERVSVVDIAPTIARVLGIRPAQRVQGSILRQALR